MDQVIFRADASSNIGGGHIYRCLTLADALQQATVAQNREQNRIHFICRDLPGHLAALIKQRGFSITLLPVTQDFNQSADALACRAVLYQRAQRFGPIDWLVVDHYQLDRTWQRILSPLTTQLAVIDDLANRHHLCDLLFDQSLGRSAADYQSWLTSRCQKVLSGTQQALLRPQFMALRDAAKDKRANTTAVQSVLVAMGATDPDNVTQAVLSQLQRLPEAQHWHIDVVLSDQAKHLAALKSWLAALKNGLAAQATALSVQLHVNVSNMAELILQADIAIAAAGTSMLERCCLGLPTVLLCLADNQRHIANAVKQSQSAIAVLDKAQLDGQLAPTLNHFTRHMEGYQGIADKAFAICNGEGAVNLVRQLQQPPATSRLTLQPVCRDDMDLLYQWQLAPKTRQHARNPHPPTPAQHRQWFDAVMNNRAVIFYLLKQGDKACGYVRLNPKSLEQLHGFEVSVALAPDCYGQGLGPQGLLLLLQLHGEKPLLAYIEAQNHASIKAFGKAGFMPLKDNWYQAINPSTTSRQTHE